MRFIVSTGFTYSAQSTAIMRVMSSVGNPTDVSTITMVTRPAWGMPAAPMLAAVAVILGVMEKEAWAFLNSHLWRLPLLLTSVDRCSRLHSNTYESQRATSHITAQDGGVRPTCGSTDVLDKNKNSNSA